MTLASWGHATSACWGHHVSGSESPGHLVLRSPAADIRVSPRHTVTWESTGGAAPLAHEGPVAPPQTSSKEGALCSIGLTWPLSWDLRKNT